MSTVNLSQEYFGFRVEVIAATASQATQVAALTAYRFNVLQTAFINSGSPPESAVGLMWGAATQTTNNSARIIRVFADSAAERQFYNNNQTSLEAHAWSSDPSANNFPVASGTINSIRNLTLNSASLNTAEGFKTTI